VGLDCKVSHAFAVLGFLKKVPGDCDDVTNQACCIPVITEEDYSHLLLELIAMLAARCRIGLPSSLLQVILVVAS
jgi:hypothetical protein